MPSPSLDIDQTISAIIRRRPVLEPVLKSFAPLLKARDEAASGLVPVLGAASVRLPKFDRQKARAGIPLLADFPGRGLGEAIRMAAEKLLPLFAEQAALQPHLAALEKFFLAAAEDDREALLEAMLVGSAESQAKIAEKNGLPPAVLNYVAEFVISAVLRALAAATDEANPWDEEAAWRQGYCPVCGSFPSIAWLDRPFWPAGAAKNTIIASCAAQTGRSGAAPAPPVKKKAPKQWKYCAKRTPTVNGLTGAPIAGPIAPQ